MTPSITKSNATIDGDPIWEWRHGAKSNSVILGELDLSDNPSVANHSVFLALDTRLLSNATLELLIDAGDGVWHSSGTGIEHMHLSNGMEWNGRWLPEADAVYQCGDAQQGSRLWAVSSFQLQMAATGTARFGMRLSNVKAKPPGAVLQLRKIGAAIVGTGWDRMFALTR